MSAFRHILVPTDFGPASQQAVERAIELAIPLDAELTLLHAYELPAAAYSEMMYLSSVALDTIASAAREHLDALLLEVQKRVPRSDSVVSCGLAVDEILSAIATRKVDLVVMGTHGFRGIRHALLGSIAEKVVRLSPVPVLTVHAPKPSPPADATRA